MELQLQVTEEELLEFPEVRPIKLILVIIQLVKLFTALKRKVATRIAVEAMEAVVQIHLPRLKLKNHTINDQ